MGDGISLLSYSTQLLNWSGVGPHLARVAGKRPDERSLAERALMGVAQLVTTPTASSQATSSEQLSVSKPLEPSESVTEISSPSLVFPSNQVDPLDVSPAAPGEIILADDGPTSLCVRLALAAKDAVYERRPLSTLTDSAKSSPLVILYDGEKVFRGTAGILRHIDDIYPDMTPLFPKDAEANQRVQSWIDFDQEDLGRLYALLALAPPEAFRPRSRSMTGESFPPVVQLNKHLDRLDKALTDKLTIEGSTITAADLALLARMEVLRRLGIDVDASRPGLSRWRQALASMPVLIDVLTNEIDVVV